MVYESRVGETFLLGASTWRIEEIRPDRVIVTPAPGEPGKMPFWHGDGPGRPLELGRAIGSFVREVRQLAAAAAFERLQERHGLDDLAAENLLAYLKDQAEATGDIDACCFYLTQAYVFALACGAPEARGVLLFYLLPERTARSWKPGESLDSGDKH